LSWIPVLDLDWKSWLLQATVFLIILSSLLFVAWRYFIPERWRRSVHITKIVFAITAIAMLFPTIIHMKCEAGGGWRGGSQNGLDTAHGDNREVAVQRRAVPYDIDAKVFPRAGGWVLELRKAEVTVGTLVVNLSNLDSWREELHMQCQKIRNESGKAATKELKARLEVPRAFSGVGTRILIDQLMTEGVRVIETVTK